jgi:hypothetical protein
MAAVMSSECLSMGGLYLECEERGARSEGRQAIVWPVRVALLTSFAASKKEPVVDMMNRALGYSCRGGSGTFTLQRRTASNLTVELALDLGTWSHFVIAIVRVSGIGFKASLMLPVSAQATPGAQYPIGGAEQWTKVVENLAALVNELDRTFVPDIERAAGPSPEWYRPG